MHWAQRDDAEAGRNGEVKIRGQKTEDRRQIEDLGCEMRDVRVRN